MGETKIIKIKRFINNPENLTPELLEDFAEAHEELVTLSENHMVVNNRLTEADRVIAVTQDGSGHEPAISGFVGEGMVGIFMVGDVFTASEPQACLDTIKPADRDKGVLYIVLNHTDDMLTDSPTMEGCAKKGLNVVRIVTQEDIANVSRFNANGRRGLVERVPTYKIVGVVATEGESLEGVAVTAQRFANNMATLAVVVSGATHPVTGSLLTDLGEDEMEIGIGQHGEGGGGHQTMKSVDETVKIMLDDFSTDLDIREGEKIILVFNGTGATTLMKLFIIYHRCVSYLKEKNIEITTNYVGESLAIQEQAGFQMFVVRVDDGLLHCWNVLCSMSYMKE